MARGRRLTRTKLHLLDPAATERYLLHWSGKLLHRDPSQFPPITSANLFGNDHPFEVEIGAGSGEFLAGLAQAHPERNYLAIEVSHRRSNQAAWLASQQGLPNLRVLWANFKQLRPLLPPGGWERVYLHFPDPVHRSSDERRNVFDAGFLDDMALVLPPGGELSVMSDRPDFFERMLDLAESDQRFRKAHDERYLQGFEPAVKSLFQLYWERKGVQPLRFVLRRI